jgi:Cytochrome P450
MIIISVGKQQWKHLVRSQCYNRVSAGQSVTHFFSFQLQLDLPVIIVDMLASLLQDSTVIISLFGVLCDPDHWGDPEVYRPERFLDSNGKFVKDEWLINFGIGKRFCIGESMARSILFIFFATFLHEFSVSIPEGDPRPTTMPQPGFTTAPYPYRMKLQQRV